MIPSTSNSRLLNKCLLSGVKYSLAISKLPARYESASSTNVADLGSSS